MHLFYTDESYDQQRFVMTALGVEDAAWRPAFEATKTFRRRLRDVYGIRLRSELHAKEFVRDCSDNVSTRKLGQADRRVIFGEVLDHMASLPITLINVCLEVPRFGSTDAAHIIAVERLANRIQVMMRVTGSHAVGIFDEGKEQEIQKIVRRMGVFNPIPSAFGGWAGGNAYKNLVLDRFLEDPVFKSSASSYFLQMVDFAAWSLLKREVPPTRFIARFGYEQVHTKLEPICLRAASRKDPLGIVR